MFETERLDNGIIPYFEFPNTEGVAYSMGNMSRDSWYLYTLNPPSGIKGLVGGIQEPDQTLEILMTHLDPKIMTIFTKESSKSGMDATIVRNNLQ